MAPESLVPTAIANVGSVVSVLPDGEVVIFAHE